jgi:hypothetical protein
VEKEFLPVEEKRVENLFLPNLFAFLWVLLIKPSTPFLLAQSNYIR